LSEDEFRALLNGEADHEFMRRQTDILLQIQSRADCEARLRESEADLKAPIRLREGEDTHIQVPAVDTPDADAGDTPAKSSFLDKGMVVFLVVSLFLLAYTFGNVIVVEHIFPAIGKDVWKGMLVSGVMLSGILMVPLSFSWGITQSRKRRYYRNAINGIAAACALLFLFQFFSHQELIAARAHMAGTNETPLLVRIGRHTKNITRLWQMPPEVCGVVSIRRCFPTCCVGLPKRNRRSS
jgi:hypothetical protein